MFDHNVAFDEMVYWVKKYLRNVSDNYFIIVVFGTGAGKSESTISEKCSEMETSLCFIVKSETLDETLIVIDMGIETFNLKPDWKDVMWKMRSSSLLESADTGLREDPGCDSGILYQSYHDTIYALESFEANTISAGITYCADNHYPIENVDYAIDVTDDRTEFHDFINFDRDSSNFKEVCFSTCCWSLVISP